MPLDVIAPRTEFAPIDARRQLVASVTIAPKSILVVFPKMKPKVSNQQRRSRLAIRHRLIGDEFTNSISSITDNLVAVHSSDPATVYLSLAARMKRPSQKAIYKALYEKKTVIRHHAMRRTIWVMTPRIAQLAHSSATVKIAKAEKKRTLEAFARSEEISDAVRWYAKAQSKILKYLQQNGPKTAREIGKALPELAIPVPFGSPKHTATLNAHTKILQGGGFDGVFCRGASVGGWLSAEYVWQPTEDWMQDGFDVMPEHESAPVLLREWLRSFGPATLTDIKWWFGWTLTLVRAALKSIQAVEVELENGSSAWVRPEDVSIVDEPHSWVQLLPGLDATTMGWKERDWYVDEAVAKAVFDRNGNAGPTIWADGRVIGGWIQKPDASIQIELYYRLTQNQQKLLADATARTATYLRSDVVRPRFPAPNQKTLLGAQT